MYMQADYRRHEGCSRICKLIIVDMRIAHVYAN